MSVIAVDGVPMKYNLTRVLKLLAPVINGNFQGLNFVPGAKNKKIAYLRLSEKLDPHRVVNKLNAHEMKAIKIHAFIPDHIPEMQIANKLKQVPLKLRRSLRIAPDFTPQQLISQIHDQIMLEMQSKFTGLYELNCKTKLKGQPMFINTISKVVHERLIEVIKSDNSIETCFNLSRLYRKKHPHFGDFQLILSSLHQMQDAAGIPRVQLQESELTNVMMSPYMVNNLPVDKLQAVCTSYSDEIANKVLEHVKNLNTELSPNNHSQEERARAKVREHLKKMTPYLPAIIKHVISKYFVPCKPSWDVVRVYGEPYLPNKDSLMPWLKRFRALSSVRDPRMYNLARVRVPRGAAPALLAADGALLGGAKLVIRPFDLPQHKVSIGGKHNEDVKEATPTQGEEQTTMEGDPDSFEDWNEQW